MATTALTFASRTATEPLITAPLLYLLTRGPPHIRERILAPFRNNLLAHNGVAKIAALIAALKVLTTLGVVQRINAALNALALNNWHLGRPGREWNFGPGKEEIVVITGASSGFGREMVKGFQGCARVVAIDIAPFPDELAKLQDVTFYHCDITDNEAIQDTCRQIRTRHGDPTVLINNAGIAPKGRSVLESTNADTERLFRVNLTSHFALIREFLPGMLQQRKGHIVTMASMASFFASAGLLDYSCSKVAALYLSDGIRAECLSRYPNGECINTTSVHPYWHATGILPETAFDKLRKRGFRVDPASNVSNAVVKQVLKGKSGHLYVPGKYKWTSGIRNLPLWVTDLMTGAWKGQKSEGFQAGQVRGVAADL